MVDVFLSQPCAIRPRPSQMIAPALAITFHVIPNTSMLAALPCGRVAAAAEATSCPTLSQSHAPAPITLVTRESTTTTSPPGMGDTYDTDSVTLTPERGVVVSSAAVEMVSARVAGAWAGGGDGQRCVRSPKSGGISVLGTTLAHTRVAIVCARTARVCTDCALYAESCRDCPQQRHRSLEP